MLAQAAVGDAAMRAGTNIAERWAAELPEYNQAT